LDNAVRIVVLVGAGISTDSGIPDFRGPQGVWTLNPKAERMSDISYYVSDPEVRELAWQSRLEHPAWTAQPNSGHRALVTLEDTGRLSSIVTQNIDGLQQLAGSSPEKVIEVHGTVREVACLSCDYRAPMEEALDRVRAGEADPRCLDCGGLLKSATISFGQNLVPEVIDRAFNEAETCDLMLCVGSTLTVYPVAALPKIASNAGAKVVTINGEPTAYDRDADAVLQGDIATMLALLIG
ncbi:MAG: Sir2 family NAD-dependent protein deacetylase, partial [Microthrixaceae bacterium]|nr:Sir2 family NAD-dependent protein deacetylase [Microthrixaceae bacterium]